MYKTAILLNVSGFPKNGEIKCLVLGPGFYPQMGVMEEWNIWGEAPRSYIKYLCCFTGDPQAIVSLSG
jgi:hypothetical protein